ncbi:MULTISPECIES: TMEM175 family protein [Microvirga]|uniref:TMEM175 family protein n=1 Tax=Microvirga TaxID=186650 RepID=UPI0021C7BBF1|nr:MULTISPECIES: TMEM175 family protein [unclassified Microvirga]
MVPRDPERRGGAPGRPVTRWGPGREASRGTGRVEAFSDAVIAIMLTLLAVELLKFDPAAARDHGLLVELTRRWPSYLAFGLTFVVVGQIWMTHHNLWRYIAKVDQGICILNLLLMAFLAVTPFAAEILADSFAALPRADQRVAASLYSTVMLGQAIAFNIILWWARRRDLLDPRVDDRLYRAIAVRYLYGPSIYAAAFLVGLFMPVLGMACYVAVILLYLRPGPGDLPPGHASVETVE